MVQLCYCRHGSTSGSTIIQIGLGRMVSWSMYVSASWMGQTSRIQCRAKKDVTKCTGSTTQLLDCSFNLCVVQPVLLPLNRWWTHRMTGDAVAFQCACLVNNCNYIELKLRFWNKPLDSCMAMMYVNSALRWPNIWSMINAGTHTREINCDGFRMCVKVTW